MADEGYRKAVQLLARRPHFEREIRRKLEQRGFDAAVCDEVLSRLSEEGLLDDEQTAVGFVESKLRRGPVGARRLRAELGRRGAAGVAIDHALATAMPDSEEDLAREAARRWLARGRTDRAALQRHLDRLGFGARDIVSASSAVPGADDATHGDA